MEPVSQLDDDDANVLRHGHQHLADALSLSVALGDIFCGPVLRQKVKSCELGDAVHQTGYLNPETLLQLLLREATVLNDIVEKGGGQRSGVLAEIGKVEGCAQGVFNIGLARHAGLAIMLLGGKLISLLHQLKPVF